MFLDFLLISFIVAFLRGGRLKEIPKFTRYWILAISVVLQLGSAIFHHGIGNVLVSFAYLFAVIFLYFNKEFEDIRIIMIGWMLNAIVIWSNLGHMPLELSQAKKTGFDVNTVINGQDWKHSVLGSGTHFTFLSDIIFLRYPIPRVISIGDIFIALGAFLLIQRIMNKPISLQRLHEGRINETSNNSIE